LLGQKQEIRGREIFKRSGIVERRLFVGRLDQQLVDWHVASNIQIRQNLFGNAAENRRGDHSTFVQTNRGIKGNQNSYSGIIDGRETGEGCDELRGRIPAGIGIGLLGRTGLSGGGPAV